MKIQYKEDMVTNKIKLQLIMVIDICINITG